jgi:hypothetical protein
MQSVIWGKGCLETGVPRSPETMAHRSGAPRSILGGLPPVYTDSYAVTSHRPGVGRGLTHRNSKLAAGISGNEFPLGADAGKGGSMSRAQLEEVWR